MDRVVARCASAALVGGLCVATVACGGDEGGVVARARPPRPVTERVLLGPPDPQAGTRRGVFVADPRGQVERIAAGGRLVAWSVRTPADRLRENDTGVETDAPLRLPARSVVVVADERGGAPLKLDVGRRWVRRLRMLRGPQGDAAPQLAVEACGDLKARRCATQLVTLAARPLRIVGPSTSRTAAAVAGRVDEGRQVVAGSRRGHTGGPGGCAPRLSIERLDGTHRRALPAIRFAPGFYTRCTRFERAELHGRYAFAWIDGRATGRDTAGLEGTTVVALDVDGGPRARWRAVQWPYRYSDGSTGYEIGPAITDAAMYWEEIDGEDERTYSLELVALPRDVLHAPRPGTTPTTADPVTPGATTACDLAATDDAVYELDNARCAPFGDSGGSAGGGIHRIVAPAFRAGDG